MNEEVIECIKARIFSEKTENKYGQKIAEEDIKETYGETIILSE